MEIMVWAVQQNLGLRPLLVLHIHISPSTSSGQCNCASWVSQPQKSVTLKPQPGGETTKSIRDMWWHWDKNLSFNRSSLHMHVFLFHIPVAICSFGCFRRHFYDQLHLQWRLSFFLALITEQKAVTYAFCLNLLTTTIVAPPSNASKWQMEFNSAFKGMHEKPTNTPIIHSVYELCMVAPTCFDMTVPSSGSVPSAF